MMRFAVALITTLTLTIVCAAAEAQKKDVDITAADGANLKGTYFSADKNGPAILLLHQYNMDRHAWDDLANDLAGAGFHVLTFDFRGFGDSDGKTRDQAERQAMMQQKWPGDVDAAFAYLLAQNGVDKSHLALGGASCGVTQSSNLAARHHEIKALIELSGMATEGTRAYIAQTPGVAVFGAVSEGDTSAAKGVKELVAASKNARSQVHMYPGSAHGVPMFVQNADLEPMIVSWLKMQERGKGNTE